MERNRLDLPADKIADPDLDSLVRKTDQLNGQNRPAHTIAFPKDPSRWLSHYVFEPRPITLTREGEVQGGAELPGGIAFRPELRERRLRTPLLRRRRSVLRSRNPFLPPAGRQARRLRH